jgi:hypothetical protein
VKSIKEALCVIVGCLFFIVSLCRGADAGEDLQYRRIKLDDVVCDVGIAYRNAPYGMDIAVSSVALGKFEDFRRWRVEKIKLRIGDARIRPDKCEKFFVRKASFWKYPAAILWAVIGSQYTGLKSSGTFAEGIGKIGMALGLGILTLQAKGDIPGEVCTFRLKQDIANSISYGVDSVRIEIRNQDTNESDDIAVILTRAPQSSHDSSFYSRMPKDELLSRLDQIDAHIAGLQSDLKLCRSDKDPQCADIESKLESMRAEQAIIYNTWASK